MGLSERKFWRLTQREYDAHLRQFERAHGIKPPLTEEQQKNKAYWSNWIMQGRALAHNKLVDEQRRRAERSGITLVPPIPDRDSPEADKEAQRVFDEFVRSRSKEA